MEFDTIQVDVTDQIMTITLDRPHRMNAFTGKMRGELLAEFDRSEEDDDLRGGSGTGSGKACGSGEDISGGAESFDYVGGSELSTEDVSKAKVNGELRDGGGILTLRIFRCTKPVIAAINGAAVGVGATMTLPMDIRLASEHAKFGFVFAARGIVPEACSSWFLPRLVGISTAAEWCYTARVFPVADALAAGLVRSVHPADELLPAARALATEIATNSAPVSVALSRMMLWRMLGAADPMEAHKIDSRGVNYTGRTPDSREGISAFLEKRPAEWRMKVSEDLPPYVPWWDEPEFS